MTLLVASVGGIVLDRYGRDLFGRYPHPAGDGWLPAGALFALWWLLAGVCIFVWHRMQRRSPAFAVTLLLAAVSFTAAAWHDSCWDLFARDEIARYAGLESGPACLDAIAVGAAELLPANLPTPLRALPSVERTRLDVRAMAIRDGAAWRAAAGNCLLVVDGRLGDIRPGDRLRVFGQLAHTSPPLNPGEFDFAEYARGDQRLVAVRSGSPAAVTITKTGARWRPLAALESLRGAARRIIQRNVGMECAALASAILLGDRSGLTDEETNTYLVTGTVHLLVVSGMNVAILAVGLHLALRFGWIRRQIALAIIVVVVTGYTLLAGWQAPIVRAGVLAVLWCIAAWTGRRTFGYNALAAAAIVVLVFNPADVFRAGPQLSFLAVAALIWINDWRIEFRRRHPPDRLDQLIAAARPWLVRQLSLVWRWNAWLLLTTMVVWVSALPLVLARFHVVTPVTLLISPAIWLIIWVAMWSGFLMLLAGLIVPPLAAMLGALCAASLAALDGVVHWAETLPAGHFWSTAPAAWWIVGFYAGLVVLMAKGPGSVRLRWQAAAACGWIAAGCVPAIGHALSRHDLRCSFIAVGHGTCVLVEGPGGETLLYDAGSLGAPELATRTVSSYLWERGLLRIDGLVLSHADTDHYNAVPGLLARFRIGTIYMSPVMFRECGFAESSGAGGAKPRADGNSNVRVAADGPGA